MRLLHSLLRPDGRSRGNRLRCDYRVNWREAKASSLVKAGDIISCAGKGRCEVKAVELTKKERYAVQILRYV